MRIPPYWAKETYTGTDPEGNERAFAACGWSFESAAKASEDAKERAKRVFDRLSRGERPPGYDYLDRPLREEIVDTLTDGEKEIAKITRNRYGALVLNTASVCLADVDFPAPRYHGFFDVLLALFSSSRRKRRLKEGREATFRSVREWAERHPQRSFRLYRTRAGLRLVFTDRPYDPSAPETLEMLADLGSDSLYRKLTETQQCFRARLTAKPWRCGCGRPPKHFPWADAEEERTYREWQHQYEEKTAAYAACRHVETFGAEPADQEIRTIVEIHDRFACGTEQTELA